MLNTSLPMWSDIRRTMSLMPNIPKDVQKIIPTRVGHPTDECISLFDPYKVVHNLEKEYTTTMPQKGSLYTLKGKSCDGFEMTEKTYLIVDYINEFHGVTIDSFIVKQVDGPRGVIFTLSKNDCKELGIEFEEGLQLLPRTMKWENVMSETEFDGHTLYTSPRSKADGTIRYLGICLSGFVDEDNGYIITPNGTVVKEEVLYESLGAKLLKTLHFGNSDLYLDEGRLLKCHLVKSDEDEYSRNKLITDDGKIYMLFTLKRGCNASISADGEIGINPVSLTAEKVSDIFDIWWDESNSVSLDTFSERQNKIKNLKLIVQERYPSSNVLMSQTTDEYLNTVEHFLRLVEEII